MEKLEENELVSSILMNKFVENETLYQIINEEDSISTLSCLFQLLHARINKGLAEKRNFTVNRILDNDCPFNIKKNALHAALRIQADNTEFKNCLHIFNENITPVNGEWEQSSNLLQLLCIGAVIIEFDLIFKESFIHVDMFKLKMFLLKMCGFYFSKDIAIDKASLFLKYFDIIASEDLNFIDETIVHFVEKKNFNFLCLLFDKKLSILVTGKIFQNEVLWNFVKIHVASNDYVKKKQAQYILWKTIEYFKTNDPLVPEALKMQNIKDWDCFFILLEMSREKQLHLIQPTLKLLPSITNLDMAWQICIYQELLSHSQLTVVYYTIDHILQLSFFVCDKTHQELLRHIIMALNKFEYSNLSKNLFKKLELFCNKLPEECYCMIFEEFWKIQWNPAAAWCVLFSASSILHKIPEHLILGMLQCLSRLSHVYIKQGCLILYIEKLFYNHDNIVKHFLTIVHFLVSFKEEMYRQVLFQIVDKKQNQLEKCCKILTEKIEESMKTKDAKYLVVYLELMKKLDKELDYELKLPFSRLDDILVFYFPKLLHSLNIATYVVNRWHNMLDDDYQYLLKYLETSPKEEYVNISCEECWNVWNLVQDCEKKYQIASYLTYRMTEVKPSSFDSTLIQKGEQYFARSSYHDCKLLINSIRKCSNKEHLFEDLDELVQKFLELMDTRDDNNFKLIVDNIELVIKYSTVKRNLFKLLDRFLMRVCELSNRSMRNQCAVFLESIFESNLFSCPWFIKHWEKWYTQLFENYLMDYESLMRVILEGCRKIILSEALYASALTPLILSSITRGIIVQKIQRINYGICQEIHDCIGSTFIQNPNVEAAEWKMLSIECLYLLAKNNTLPNSPSADSLIEQLLDLYMHNYKKRYFPHSKIHLEKLRIVQSMLLLANFADKTKEKLIQFILTSFCEESHQPSVKQLLQWLLLMLASRCPSYSDSMIEKIAAQVSNVSTVIAIIPVVYHLVTSLNDEKNWFKLSDSLLPLTMGANFKLRIYSQITLRNILRRAEQKQLTNYVEKYSFLKNTISTVIDATGNAVSETLKNDMIFIENFDPNLHYTVENIFVTLPRMLDVPSYEWENTLKHKFSENFDVDIENVHKLPTKIFTDIDEIAKIENEVAGINVQKKIIPWKQDIQEKLEGHSLNNLICVASLVEKSSNLGGLSRTCEVFDIKQLVLHNVKIRDDKEFKSLSMSSENWVDFMEVKRDDLSNFMVQLKQRGYSIVGLEQTSESVKLDQFKFEPKTVLLLGNESRGIPAPLLPVLDTCVEIPQFGQTRSLNVHVAAATCIWEYVKQHLC